MSWTPERITELRNLHAKGWSFAMISKEIGAGLSRNACIGKAKRLGLERGGKSSPRRPSMVMSRRSRSDWGTMRGPRQKLTQAILGIAPVQEIPTGEPESKMLSLFDLSSKTCKWPSGDGTKESPFTFCGHSPQGGSPYCPFHFELSLPPQRRKSACVKADDTDASNHKQLVNA